MPAWGFADVLRSSVPGLEDGERERGFYDGTAHRQALTSAYNQYQRVRTDAAHHRWITFRFRAGPGSGYHAGVRTARSGTP
jgi:hypothetical protein